MNIMASGIHTDDSVNFIFYSFWELILMNKIILWVHDMIMLSSYTCHDMFMYKSYINHVWFIQCLNEVHIILYLIITEN